MFEARGKFGTVMEISIGGITAKLKPKYRYQVLVLDTVAKDEEYGALHAIDSLNSMGWCKFDDIQACLGKVQTQKVLKYCERQIAKQLKKQN